MSSYATSILRMVSRFGSVSVTLKPMPMGAPGSEVVSISILHASIGVLERAGVQALYLHIPWMINMPMPCGRANKTR